jgi:hypothetical protein
MNNHAKAKHQITQQTVLDIEIANYLKELGYGA